MEARLATPSLLSYREATLPLERERAVRLGQLSPWAAVAFVACVAGVAMAFTIGRTRVEAECDRSACVATERSAFFTETYEFTVTDDLRFGANLEDGVPHQLWVQPSPWSGGYELSFRRNFVPSDVLAASTQLNEFVVRKDRPSVHVAFGSMIRGPSHLFLATMIVLLAMGLQLLARPARLRIRGRSLRYRSVSGRHVTIPIHVCVVSPALAGTHVVVVDDAGRSRRIFPVPLGRAGALAVVAWINANLSSAG